MLGKPSCSWATSSLSSFPIVAHLLQLLSWLYYSKHSDFGQIAKDMCVAFQYIQNNFTTHKKPYPFSPRRRVYSFCIFLASFLALSIIKTDFVKWVGNSPSSSPFLLPSPRCHISQIGFKLTNNLKWPRTSDTPVSISQMLRKWLALPYLIYVKLGVEPRASCMLGKHFTILSTPNWELLLTFERDYGEFV